MFVGRFAKIACLCFVAALSLGLLTAQSFAADEPGHDGKAKTEHKEKAGDDHGHSEDKATVIFAPALDLALWTLLVFLMLLFVLNRFAWKPMLAGLQKREQTIRAAMDEAKLAQKETAKIREELQAERDKNAREIAKIMDEARRDAENLKQEIREQANAEIQSERKRLRNEIEVAKDQALHDLWSQTAQLATLISAKAIRKSMTGEDQTRLINEALSEVEAGKERSGDMMKQFGEDWERQGRGN